jgi:hypothetical protein
MLPSFSDGHTAVMNDGFTKSLWPQVGCISMSRIRVAPSWFRQVYYPLLVDEVLFWHEIKYTSGSGMHPIGNETEINPSKKERGAPLSTPFSEHTSTKVSGYVREFATALNLVLAFVPTA